MISTGASPANRLLLLSRAAVLAVGAYVGWSWNAGDAAAVWDATVASLPALSAGAAGFIPDLPAEFWKHAVMVSGVWMTLGRVLLGWG